MGVTYRQIVYGGSMAELPGNGQLGDLGFTTDSQTFYISDGTMWKPLNRVIVKKSTVAVDCKVSGAVPIYTLETSNLNFYPAQVVPRVVNVSGVTVTPSVTIGTNATAYNNIAGGSLMSSAMSVLGTGAGKPYSADTSPALSGGTVIYANVGTGAVATNYQVKYDILGYYET